MHSRTSKMKRSSFFLGSHLKSLLSNCNDLEDDIGASLEWLVKMYDDIEDFTEAIVSDFGNMIN